MFSEPEVKYEFKTVTSFFFSQVLKIHVTVPDKKKYIYTIFAVREALTEGREKGDLVICVGEARALQVY